MRDKFSERLIFLRYLKNFKWILLITLLGTILGGGLYCLKNIVFGGPAQYRIKDYYKLSYTNSFENAGDYYINEYTWNTYAKATSFLELVEPEIAYPEGAQTLTIEQLQDAITAYVESDYYVIDYEVVTENSALSEAIMTAVSKVMTEQFANQNEQLIAVSLLSKGTVEKVPGTARPGRAFLLAAILSAFLSSVVYLIWETKTDSIYLPETITEEFGMKAFGMGPERFAHLDYLFGGKNQVALCTVTDEQNPVELCKEIWSEDAASGIRVPENIIRMPAPLLAPEISTKLREMDAVLLAVPAGSGSGVCLKQVLDFLKTQDVTVTAVLLTDMDEWLVRNYYRMQESK